MKTINEIGKLFTATFIIAISLLITLYTSYEIIIELGIIVVGAILALVMYILSSKYEKGLESELRALQLVHKETQRSRDLLATACIEKNMRIKELERETFTPYDTSEIEIRGTLQDGEVFDIEEYRQLKIDLANQIKATDIAEKRFNEQVKVIRELNTYLEQYKSINIGIDVGENDGVAMTINQVFYDMVYVLWAEFPIKKSQHINITNLIKQKETGDFISPKLPFSEDNDTTDQGYICTQCNSSNVRETAHYVICNECGKRKKKTGYGTKLDKELR